jgi:formate--tetrahydrofolate ligase
LPALEAGLVNLERHINNITKVYNLPLVVSINNFTSDTKAEVELLRARVEKIGVKIVLATHWADGGKGAADLAHAVVELCEQPQAMTFVYEDSDPLWEKVTKVATKIYGAKEVTADAKVRLKLKELEASGYGHFPICVAKTQYSFSTDAALRGAPSGHSINVREVKLSAGAEFIVMICGEIMTMPGLPKVPSAERIDYIDGKVVGLF